MMQDRLYGGYAELRMEPENFDLGFGVELRSVYVHIMSPCLVAFARPVDGGHHPAPWSTADGGFAYDIELEISVPRNQRLPGRLTAEEALWWISALLRLSNYPQLLVPVLADEPLVAPGRTQSRIRPHETLPRLFSSPAPGPVTAPLEVLEWLRDTWSDAATMLADRKFRLAVETIDACAINGRAGPSLLAAMAALEQLFQPDRGELRYRLASNVAAYAFPPGEERLACFKRMLALYDVRSKIAHGGPDIEREPLVEAWVVGRNALVKMVNHREVPSQAALERLIMCAEAIDDLAGNAAGQS